MISSGLKKCGALTLQEVRANKLKEVCEDIDCCALNFELENDDQRQELAVKKAVDYIGDHDVVLKIVKKLQEEKKEELMNTHPKNQQDKVAAVVDTPANTVTETTLNTDAGAEPFTEAVADTVVKTQVKTAPVATNEAIETEPKIIKASGIKRKFSVDCGRQATTNQKSKALSLKTVWQKEFFNTDLL